MKARVKGKDKSFVTITNIQLENHAEVYHPEDLEFEPTVYDILSDLKGNHIYTTEDFKRIQEASEWWDWEKFRREAATAALQGMLAHSRNNHGYHPRDPKCTDWHQAIAEEAIELADALIEQLKSRK